MRQVEKTKLFKHEADFNWLRENSPGGKRSPLSRLSDKRIQFDIETVFCGLDA